MVPVNLVGILWDKCVPHLEALIPMSYGQYTVESVKERALRGATTLILVIDGEDVVAVNTIQVDVKESGLRVLELPLTSGSRLDEWEGPFITLMKALAKEQNCTEIIGYAARKGWIRRLEQYGFTEAQTIIRCELGE